MKRLLLVYLLSIQFAFVLAQDNDTISQKFNSELTLYIDSNKPNSIYKGKYDIYVANFFSLEKNEFCFSLGIIENEFEYDYVSPDYVYYFHKEIILIRLTKEDTGLVSELQLKKINSVDIGRIDGKLFPNYKGAITNDEDIFIFCDENNKIEKGFYPDNFSLPFEKSIYKKFPSGVVIKRVK